MNSSVDLAPTYAAPSRARLRAVLVLAVAVCVLLVASALTASWRAVAANSGLVDLGTADSYSVIGGQSMTNTGPSVLSDVLGVSPGTSITGFPPGVTLGTQHQTDAAAGQAQSDVTIAYNDAAGRATTAANPPDLVGQTLVAGVYTSSTAAPLSGT